jgi:hypothetical protein
MPSVDASELVITAFMGHRVLSALLTGNLLPKAKPIVSSRGTYRIYQVSYRGRMFIAEHRLYRSRRVRLSTGMQLPGRVQSSTFYCFDSHRTRRCLVRMM